MMKLKKKIKEKKTKKNNLSQPGTNMQVPVNIDMYTKLIHIKILYEKIIYIY
jgi:hypothetical protein